jgi:ubiquinone/menaquinone biosynthesis C-methylase UbiE
VNDVNEEKAKKIVRECYAKAAKKERSCCGSEASRKIGYSEKELGSVPQGADLGLGCGNPVALASLKEGETVVDLGSGGGLDCFLAAKSVGEKGHVIGIDMTPEMLDTSRENLRKSNHKNVEFRLGEIENLPVADNTADVVISNCVINLSPDKKRVFEEAFRVLKPDGRLMISDIVLLNELPEAVRQSVEAYVGCVAGAVIKAKYLELIRQAGFRDVRIVEEKLFPIEYVIDNPTAKAAMKKAKISAERAKKFADTVASIRVHAVKPE